MKLVTASREDLAATLDRPLQWRTAACLLVGLTVMLSIAIELLVTGGSRELTSVLDGKFRSLSTWTILALEYAGSIMPFIGGR